ncbi:MAG: ribosomal protein S18-alanine N-acetyltransferase [Gammaproteobacteria bacterium]
MSAQREPAPVQLRPMRTSDIDAVMEVERAAYPYPWTAGIFRDCLRIGYCCWIAEADDGVAGYVVMSVGAGEAHLLNLCVAPARQRTGLGRMMLDHVFELARSHRAKALFLEVRPSNDAALHLYRVAGFVEVGLRNNYYPAARGQREDAIVLALPL